MMRGLVWCLTVLCLCAPLADAQVAGETILEDDFSGEELDAEKWIIRAPDTEGSFARIEDGVAHVLGVGAEASLRTRAEVPCEHVVEFDYYQPPDERSGGYQNHVSCTVTKKAEGHDWSGGVWYIESSGTTFSHHNGLWGNRSSMGPSQRAVGQPFEHGSVPSLA
jgi:hypothetical protein